LNNQNGNLLADLRNLELLKILLDNPRIALSEVARRIGMSSPAVKERITRLEEAGIIAGYRVELSPQALGYPVTAFVRVRPAPGQLSKVAELAKQMPEVVECHRITGEDCFILKIHIGSIGEHLDRVLDQFLVYGQTTTSIVQSTPVPARPLPLVATSSARAG
jgi:Lrp/AsnC family transcriptional regulator, leucine-responsive regulatory protein